MSTKSMAKWADDINEWCSRKGWNQNLVLGNMIANLHTEISEAWEEIRNGRAPDAVYEGTETYNGLRKPEGFGIELADLIIRVLHICAHYKIPIEELMERKMAFNERRPYRHGGKTA
jgi:NTP pyrophosphatase (non-canonical NTP hydrolase)